MIFPEDVQLDETVLDKHKGMKDSELRLEALPVSTQVSRLQKPPYLENENELDEETIRLEERTEHASFRIYWRIADLNKESMKKGRAAAMQNPDDEAFANDFLKGARIS